MSTAAVTTSPPAYHSNEVIYDQNIAQTHVQKRDSLNFIRVGNIADLPYIGPLKRAKGETDTASDSEENLKGDLLNSWSLALQAEKEINSAIHIKPTLTWKGYIFQLFHWLSGVHNYLPVSPDSVTSAATPSSHLDQPTLQSILANDTPSLVYNDDAFPKQDLHTRRKRSNSENDMPSFMFDNVNMTPPEIIRKTGELCLDKAQCQTLAKAIMEWQGLYTEPSDTPMPLNNLKTIIRKWIEDNTYKAGFADYTLRKILENSNIVSVKNLKSALNPTEVDTLYGAEEEVIEFIQQNIVFQKLPILDMPDQTDNERNNITDLKLADVDWLLINAGLDYYNRLTQHLEDPAVPLDDVEARMLGEILYEKLRIGAVPDDLASCFTFASLVRYGVLHQQALQQDKKISINDVAQQGLSAFFRDYEAHLLATNPLLKFEHLVNQYQTRPQLAKSILEKECAHRGIDPNDYLNNPDSTFCRTVEQMYLDRNKHPFFLKLLERLGIIHREGTILEDINKTFDRQNKELTAAYGELDKILVANVFDTLPESDLEFLHQATLQQVDATFVPVVPSINQPNGAAGMGIEHNKVRLDNHDFIKAHHDNKERIYAITMMETGYHIERMNIDIDRDDEQYRRLTNKLIDGFTYKLNIYPRGDVIHQPDTPLKRVVDPLVETHKKKYLTKVHEFGYEETSFEKTKKFLTNLIPGVLCARSINEGRVDDATLYCGLEAAIFTGALLKLGSASIRVGQVFTEGALKSLAKNAQALTARQSLRALLPQLGKDVAQYAMHPAFEKVIKPQAPGIITSFVRAADPGLEISYRVLKGSLTKSVQLFTKMKESIPRLKQLLPRVESALNSMPETVPIQGERLKGRFPGSLQDTNVIAISETQTDGNRFCILELPNNQALPRHKMQLSTNGVLTPLPVDTTFENRIKHILSGLSSDGFKQFGKGIDPRKLETIQAYLRRHPNVINLDILARRFNVDRNILEHLGKRGKLSPAIRDSLEAGPSRRTGSAVSTNPQNLGVVAPQGPVDIPNSFVNEVNIATLGPTENLETILIPGSRSVPDHRLLDIQNYRQAAFDLMVLNDRGYYYNNIRPENLLVRTEGNNANVFFRGRHLISNRPLDNADNIVSRDFIMPGSRQNSENTGQADDSYAFLLSLMNAADTSFHPTYLNLRNRVGGGSMSLADQVQLKKHAHHFVKNHIYEQYRASVHRFIMNPRDENMLRIPLYHVIQWQPRGENIAASVLDNSHVGASSLTANRNRVSQNSVLTAPNNANPSLYQNLPSFSASNILADRLTMRTLAQSISRPNSLPVTPHFLTMQNYRQAAYDLMALHRINLYHNNIRPDNIFIQPEGNTHNIIFDTAQGISMGPRRNTDRQFYRNILTRSDRVITENTGRADDEHAFLLTLMNVADASFYSTHYYITNPNFIGGITRQTRERFAVHANAFVTNYIRPEYQQAVETFITAPTDSNILPVRVHDVIDWQTPPNIVSAIHLENPGAISTLGRQGLTAARTQEERVRLLLGQNGSGFYTAANPSLQNNPARLAAWNELMNSVDDNTRAEVRHRLARQQNRQ